VYEEERRLILGVVSGDVTATARFIGIWHPRIYRWIYQNSWLRPVEDAAQEVWYHLLDRSWERLLEWDGLYADNWRPHGLESYLKSITIHKARDLERVAHRLLPPADLVLDVLDDGPVGTDPEIEAERARVREVFDKCFQKAQERDRTNMGMWYEGKSDEDIAEELGITPNNAAQRRFQALARLRGCLRQHLSEYLENV